MCNASIQLTNVVENETMGRMQARDSFTALDISNALKTAKYSVRHREVAEVVRDIYKSGAMQHFDYDRQLIRVTTEAGVKTTEAYLYHHQSVRPDDYANLNQDALPPVPADQARDLFDCVAADPLGLLHRVSTANAAAICRKTQNKAWQTGGGRRDGALPVPSRIIAQLGWADGSDLSIRAEAGRLIVEPLSAAMTPLVFGTTPNPMVRVWSGRRVRICKSKLRLGTVDLNADAVTVVVEGGCLSIAPLP